jgi:hypothetical protein
VVAPNLTANALPIGITQFSAASTQSECQLVLSAWGDYDDSVGGEPPYLTASLGGFNPKLLFAQSSWKGAALPARSLTTARGLPFKKVLCARLSVCAAARAGVCVRERESGKGEGQTLRTA